MRLTDVTSTMETILTALPTVPPYRVGGTSAALLKGVQLPAGDIDVLVARRADVDTFAAALSPFPYPAAWLPETAPTGTSPSSATWRPTAATPPSCAGR
ncbi:hypothetical protein AB0K12_00080 [Nonomuraea sp. NPDC049419]|uniref:hypothetical protein n=1 Tax=Nonomuraea sp. NPDC049419 TaxID=3155772 RepID=UPI00341831CB